jgi:hypothetical protein
MDTAPVWPRRPTAAGSVHGPPAGFQGPGFIPGEITMTPQLPWKSGESRARFYNGRQWKRA